jgi:co-chaperonin GroES (HSP10)
MSVKIRPTCGRLLLRVVETPGTVVKGVYVPGRGREDGGREALVEALPSGYQGSLDVGSPVLLPAYCGMEIRINGALMVFAREGELLCALE